ncbi:hypothetical protein MTR67_047361 [Solanum verrucosum]|uniref:Uncharacterized protein n=1 Tax=Solanum verrucosum TaxID=315347 RepID=A0AAF0UZ73_SOLVR|nr:uncharacterized protein LOC125809329 [Solanum verrucosum]WMV53976.1 hypothetical protein MTR67_047361 [Solanum verrucosum]
MGRTFIACLSPFHQRKCIFHITNSETMALFASFTTEIKNLQSSLLSNNSLTLQWCVEAMTLLKKLHSQFLLIILEKSKVIPFTWINDDMLNLYMNESLYIMELCNMLKTSSFKINMFHLTIDTTIKNLNHYEAKSFANMQPIEQRDNKRILIQEMQRDCCSSLICTIRVAMSLLSYILLNVFMYPTKNYKFEVVDRICCKYSSPIKSFKDSVNELATEFQRKYYKDGERVVIRFYEYEEMEKAIMEAKEKFKSGYEEEEIKRIKDVILQKSIALKVGLEKFESQANQVFEGVLKGRNKLLQMVGKTNGIFR